MSEEVKLSIAVLFSNTVRILGFIALAIIFGKWWIVLFSPIFLSHIKG